MPLQLQYYSAKVNINNGLLFINSKSYCPSLYSSS